MPPRVKRTQKLNSKQNKLIQQELQKLIDSPKSSRGEVVKIVNKLSSLAEKEVNERVAKVKSIYSNMAFRNASRNVGGIKSESIPYDRSGRLRNAKISHKYARDANVKVSTLAISKVNVHAALSVTIGSLKPASSRPGPTKAQQYEYRNSPPTGATVPRPNGSPQSDYVKLIEYGTETIRGSGGNYNSFSGERLRNSNGFFLFDRAVKEAFGPGGSSLTFAVEKEAGKLINAEKANIEKRIAQEIQRKSK